MKNLFQLASGSDFVRFVWKEAPGAPSDEMKYNVDQEAKSLLEADLTEADIAKIEENRRASITAKFNGISNLTSEEQGIINTFIQNEINNSKYEGAINGKEWNEIIESSDKVLEQIVSTRKYIEKKNKIISSVTQNISDEGKKAEVVGKLNKFFAGIEKTIAENQDKIDWTDSNKVEFIREDAGASNVVPGYVMRIDNSGWNDETDLMLVDAKDPDLKFYKDVAGDLSSIFGDLKNVDFSNVETVEKSEIENPDGAADETTEGEVIAIDGVDVTDEFTKEKITAVNDWMKTNASDLQKLYTDKDKFNADKLVSLGFDAGNVETMQYMLGINTDGIVGRGTRRAIGEKFLGMSEAKLDEYEKVDASYMKSQKEQYALKYKSEVKSSVGTKGDELGETEVEESETDVKVTGTPIGFKPLFNKFDKSPTTISIPKNNLSLVSDYKLNDPSTWDLKTSTGLAMNDKIKGNESIDLKKEAAAKKMGLLGNFVQNNSYDESRFTKLTNKFSSSSDFINELAELGDKPLPVGNKLFYVKGGNVFWERAKNKNNIVKSANKGAYLKVSGDFLKIDNMEGALCQVGNVIYSNTGKKLEDLSSQQDYAYKYAGQYYNKNLEEVDTDGEIINENS